MCFVWAAAHGGRRLLPTALRRLDELLLANNDLSSLPPQLGTLTSLRALTLEGNPLKSIRRPVIERGTPAVLEWLRSRLA